jgi:hypothetical protein
MLHRCVLPPSSGQHIPEDSELHLTLIRCMLNVHSLKLYGGGVCVCETREQICTPNSNTHIFQVHSLQVCMTLTLFIYLFTSDTNTILQVQIYILMPFHSHYMDSRSFSLVVH